MFANLLKHCGRKERLPQCGRGVRGVSVHTHGSMRYAGRGINRHRASLSCPGCQAGVVGQIAGIWPVDRLTSSSFGGPACQGRGVCKSAYGPVQAMAPFNLRSAPPNNIRMKKSPLCKSVKNAQMFSPRKEGRGEYLTSPS